jgi:hypothetical protein
MLTQSQTGHLKPKTFHDFHLYHTFKHLLRVLQAIQYPLEPSTYHQAALKPEWLSAMQSDLIL